MELAEGLLGIVGLLMGLVTWIIRIGLINLNKSILANTKVFQDFIQKTQIDGVEMKHRLEAIMAKEERHDDQLATLVAQHSTGHRLCRFSDLTSRDVVRAAELILEGKRHD